MSIHDNCWDREKHDCKGKGYGNAVTDIFIDEKTDELIAGNGEYYNPVSYCPFCGLDKDGNGANK